MLSGADAVQQKIKGRADGLLHLRPQRDSLAAVSDSSHVIKRERRVAQKKCRCHGRTLFNYAFCAQKVLRHIARFFFILFHFRIQFLHRGVIKQLADVI